MISAEDIKLYPMTMDLSGKRTHQEYVDSMSNKIKELYYDYRMEFEDIYKLVKYTEQIIKETK